MKKWVVTVAVCVLSAGAVPGGEWYAATDGSGLYGTNWATAFTDLQVALDTATNGDAVYIKGDTYAVAGEQLIWTNSGVTVLGGYRGTNASGPGIHDADQWPTILNGTRGLGSTNRIMWIQSVSDCRLERVTLCNGYLNYRYPDPSPDPYLGTNDNRGANLFVSSCTNLILVDVTSSNGYIQVYSRSAYGVGAYFLNSTNVLMSGCLLQRNGMDAVGNDWLYGGGIYTKDSYLTITNCAIKGNYRDRSSFLGQGDSCRGVGAYLDGGSVTLIDSVITANDGYCRSSARGGGVYVDAGSHLFRNCLIVANDLFLEAGRTGTLEGDGIYAEGGSTVLENCTVAHNFGQGVYGGGGAIALTNCIVWGNIDDIGGSGVGLAYCDIEDGDNDGVDGCFSSDPEFDRGFYLSVGSDCVDAGVATSHSGALANYTTHADGTLDSGAVDVGYHQAGGINPAVADFYVSPSGSDGGGNSGTNWAAAFRSITKALSLAENGTRVHIGSGSYPMGIETFPLTMDKFGLQLLGTNSVDTIIAATGSGQGAIATEAVVGDAKIQGVTITGGAGTSPSSFPPFFEGNLQTRYGCGGGILLAISAVDISGCIITNNTVGSYDGKGGGIYLESSMSTVSNCLIADNNFTITLYAYGGGIFSRGNSVLTVLDSTISGNSAVSSARPAGGGGIFMGENTENYSTLRRCVIVGNQVQAHVNGDPAYGAGLMIEGISTIENCLIAFNSFGGSSTATNGGGICLIDGRLALQSVTVATNDVEGIRVTGGALTATNCIIWGNGDDLANVAGGVGYSCIEDGDFNGLSGNTNANPLFVDETYFHLKSRRADYRNGYFSGGSWSTSETSSPLIDAGYEFSDFSRELPPNGNRINMGAYGNTTVSSQTYYPAGTLILCF